MGQLSQFFWPKGEKVGGPNSGTPAFAFSNIHRVGCASATIKESAVSDDARPMLTALVLAGQDTRAVQAWLGYKHPVPCAVPNSHRPVQKLPALMGDPRSSQQLMGQLVVA